MLIGIARPPVGAGILLEPRRTVGDDRNVRPRSRAILGAASSIHFLHDGFSETLYVFLPLWARELGLSFAQVGLIRSAYTGGMSLFQIPAGFLAERFGERWLLAAGTAVTALGFVAAGAAGGFASLLALLLVAGLGSGVQHPLSSSIVSKAYEDGRRRTALGTYNFSGDVGKAGVAAAIGLLAGVVGWRAAGAAYGPLGILTVVAAPLPLALAVLMPLGIALNGTSSVLYGTVADLVSPERRSRGYGLYYTLTIAASAVAPTLWGVIGDVAGVPTTLTLVGIVVLATIPLCLALRPAVTAPAGA